MGFTPLDGLMMGTRSGSVDPGILTYLMRAQNLTGETLDDLLNKKSGLLGISGISGDMRQIVSAMNKGNDRAKLAFDIFVHRLQAGIGAMVAALGGLDALVFTAGIGENSAEVRQAACANFNFLGLQLDPAKNTSPHPDQDISTPSSSVTYPGRARGGRLGHRARNLEIDFQLNPYDGRKQFESSFCRLKC